MKRVGPPLHAHSAAWTAAKWMEERYGSPRIANQFATGAAIHFGEQALFVPGKDPLILAQLIEKRTEELACAYMAYMKALQERNTP